MLRLSLKELAGAVGGRLNRPEFGDIVISEITTDSRKVPAGALFVPIKGEFFDGHDFLDTAYANGAACALSHNEQDESRPIIFVGDTTKAFLALGSWHIAQIRPKTIAITGSNGKTTTKDLVASVMAQRFRTHKTSGNLNNHVGLPLTLLDMPADTEVAVLEMGMNHLNEISPLSRAAEPDIAIITNIGVAHIENLGSREGILQAKLEILEGLKSGGLALFNGDDDFLPGVRSEHMTQYFGLGGHNSYRGVDIVKRGVRGVSFTVVSGDTRFDVEVPVPGTHMVYNALAAAAVGLTMGLAPGEIRAGIASFIPSGLRLNISQSPRGITIIDDAYNSNPDSAAAALEVLSEAEGRKICVLGDMLELGEDAPSMHFETGKQAANAGIDLIMCVGALSWHTYMGANEIAGPKRAVYFSDKESVKHALEGSLRPGDTLLIKASRGAAFEDITEWIKTLGD